MRQLLTFIHKHKFVFALIATASLTVVIHSAAMDYLRGPEEEVLGIGDVNVTATVSSCQLDLTVRPEKRIPKTGNWDTIATVQIYQGNSLLTTFQTNTNSQGRSIVNLCNLGVNLQQGSYTFKVRGYSHLYKQFPPVAGFTTASTTISFTGSGDLLLAGETSNIFDNKINSLDISTQIVAIYSDDYKNDLNQDGKVNSLDFSNTITNFFLTGN